MPNYIFWPYESLFENSAAQGPQVALAISFEKTHFVVLGVCEPQYLEEVSIRPPYSVVATKNNGAEGWNYKVADPCNVHFRIPKLKFMQFYSSDPISLIIPEKEVGLHSSVGETLNYSKLEQHPRYKRDNKKLSETLKIINLFPAYCKALNELYPFIQTSQENLRGTMLNSVAAWCSSTCIYKMVAKIGFYLTFVICSIASLVSSLLNYSHFQLVNYSAFVQQIDLRCQQICYFPVQYERINKKDNIQNVGSMVEKDNSNSQFSHSYMPSKFYPDYILLYNTIWLIINDISFGLILGAILIENRDFLVSASHRVLKFFLYDSLKTITETLANNPLGIKLNAELANFLSELFLWVIEFSYTTFIKRLIDPKTLSSLLTLTIYMMFLVGFSFAVSLAIDFFAILSFPIYVFYRISSKLYHCQLNIMASLFNLFCGKKRNVLRNRIDHNYFQLDQLLLGTLLFIILVFLTPTVMAFYMSYTVLRMLTITIEIFSEAVIALINHFPLFALLLRLKDPKRLPGGISIELKTTVSNKHTTLELQNNPIKFKSMFRPYNLLLSQMRTNYFSFATVRKIVRGESIMVNRNKLYYVLYSSLPSKPLSVKDLYKRLTIQA
ncbi:CPS_HP_G0104420.mRNA.1.CDS.1 [Saccharomyces cerevisiae]|nr:CPS_HP_G0035720.mRNA.1.CDS.1 [Saccharomyces cerevisiae]CAI5017047.1 CPS_HP_G0089560.mRNA.1.CDS.1 [Saccharomyces cerevisiae]CAI5033354.1 CPS_HP_G0104420.mRNA.1.CDS.1 [Saccharomyces cerevisiae]CAI6587699.1 CPS_HP_G0035720.mRNA.1.CDS.1 [Saccharomyces cerevisiae]CAI6934525.1 CPS_HP_G0089560.mRNA.1.CDS.1 [Saccharomyces cerevisiae]